MSVSQQPQPTPRSNLSPTTPPSRRYLPPYVYRSSPTSSASGSPTTTSPSSSSSSKPLSRRSSLNSTLPFTPPELIASNMARGKHVTPPSTASAAHATAANKKTTTGPATPSKADTAAAAAPSAKDSAATAMQTPTKQQQAAQRSQQTETPTAAATHSHSTPSSAAAAAIPSTPASPDVLSPASIKSIISASSSSSSAATAAAGGGVGGKGGKHATPAKATQPPHVDSPAAPMASGEAVKSLVKQLSTAATGASAGLSGGKRPSVSALSSGVVAQRVADYSAAASVGRETLQQPQSEVPRAASPVAELITKFSAEQQPPTEINRTQRSPLKHRKAADTHTQTATSKAQHNNRSDAETEKSTDTPPQTQQAEVQVHTGKLHSGTSNQPPVSTATVSATPDVHSSQSRIVDTATAEMPSGTPLSAKQSRKQRKAAAASTQHTTQPTVQRATVTSTSETAKLHSAQPHIEAPPAVNSADLSALPSPDRLITRLLRRVWQFCTLCIWAALTVCGADLLLRDPTRESFVLTVLSAIAVIATLLRSLSSSSSRQSGLISAAFNSAAAIALCSLPFLFAQRLPAPSTMHWLFCLHPGIVLLCLSVPLCALTLLALCRAGNGDSGRVGGDRAESGSVGVLSSLSVHLTSAASLLCFAFCLALYHSSITSSFAPPYSTPWPPLPTQPSLQVRLIVLLQAASVLSWLLTASQLSKAMSVLSLLLTEQHLRLPRGDNTHV